MNIIKSITTTDDVTLISLQDSPSDASLITSIFQKIADSGIDVDMISQTPPKSNLSDLSFTVSDEDLKKILDVISSLREVHPELKISCRSGNCKISVFGEAMRGCPGVALRVFSAVNKANADINMITTSEVDISILVAKHDATNVVDCILKEFE